MRSGLKQYKTVLIGLGQIASRYAEDKKRHGIVTHAQAYLAHPHFDLVGGYDPDPKQRSLFEKKWHLPAYSSVDDLMIQTKASVVSITSPASCHLQNMTTLAPYKPKIIFCEKPLASTLNEGLQIQKLLSQQKIPCVLNFSRRFDKMHQTVFKDILQKKYGKLLHVEAYTSGCFDGISSHMMDLLCWLLKTPLSLQSIAPSSQGAQSYALTFSKFPQKALWHHFSLKNYLLFELDLYLEKARLRLINNGFDIRFFKAKSSKIFSGFTMLTPQKNPYGAGYKQVFEKALENLEGCLQKTTKPLCGINEGLHVLRIKEALNRLHSNPKAKELVTESTQ